MVVYSAEYATAFSPNSDSLALLLTVRDLVRVFLGEASDRKGNVYRVEITEPAA